MASKDKTGERHGRFIVIGLSHYVPNKHGGRRVYWKCLCDCGTEFLARGDGIGTNQKSCGCLHREIASKLCYKHGGVGTPEYTAWTDMKRRCLNKNFAPYKDYGGRGIKICDKWINSFSAFVEDMGIRPSPIHSLDRIDNNGNYEPLNCKWSIPVEQINNRRCTKRIEFNGENLTVAEWSQRTGLAYETLRVRIASGWNTGDLLTKPSRNRNTI